MIQMNTRFRIRELRRERGITQAQLAALLGVQQNTASQWETGDRRPSSSILPRLAAALDCTIDELYEQVPTEQQDIGVSQSSA